MMRRSAAALLVVMLMASLTAGACSRGPADNQGDVRVPAFDTTRIHTEAAVKYALGKE